ncbi:hypothetical protein SAMN05216388_1017101 [Halorientalis persicus]|uniref:Uncharacterized protein n=1 Tax=Halorientalis persicus TaxID=1367881 RepID=A0A1H8S0J1_9EURY|nr:hypothetical protein [Halorientalis persicus]SEO72057.1 hypothetical protein SAMN05216388_1017101 [Halorientalis persicus]
MAQESSELDYTHGAQGTKPSNPLDFQTGEAIPPEHFDWFWYTTIQKINALVTDIDNILNGGVTVTKADTVDGWDKQDIKDWVNSSADVPNADLADQAQSVEVRNNDPSDIEGRVWIRSDL